MSKTLNVSAILVSLFALFLLSTTVAFAEEGVTDSTETTVTSTSTQKRPGLFGDLQIRKEQREAEREANKTQRETDREALKTQRETDREVIKEGKNACKNELSIIREKIKIATTDEEKEALETEMKAAQDKCKTDLKAQKDGLKTEADKKRAENIEKYYSKAVDVMNRHLENLEKLYTKISDHITKFETAGTDMTEAKAELALARTSIDTAKSKVDALSTAATTAIPPENATSSTMALKSARTEATEAIRAAHKELVDTVKLVNNARPKKTATTTATQ